MEVRQRVREVIVDDGWALIKIDQVPNEPGVAAAIFGAIAAAGISVDLILQNAGDQRIADLSFTVCAADLPKARGCLETVQAAKEHEHWSAPLEGANRGRGIAGGFWINGSGPSSALASVNSDGTVSLVEGSPDIGGSRTVAAMHVAEVLGIAAEDVQPLVGDTSSIGFT